MPDESDDEGSSRHWSDDVLGRGQFAAYLTRVLIQRYEASYAGPERGALCVALDGDWGQGKSFFVKRWALDVADAGHPVVTFDAWQNDLADDPLVGFMAALQDGLSKLTGGGSVGRGVRSARTHFAKFKKQASRAVLPAMAVIGKGVLKKATGVDFSAVMDAGAEEAARDLAVSATESSSEALEKFFEVALKSHSEKREAITALRDSMRKMLDELYEAERVALPMFIFIDELDRCRPDYGLRLLEGTKHLFDVPGVCFVFSTNMPQLAASAKAVYGESFESYMYFKRFFACEYSLPPANKYAYATKLLANSLFTPERYTPVWPLPYIDGPEPPDPGMSYRLQFTYVADFHGLEPRAMRQVLEIAENAAAQLKKGAQLHPLYLFHLAALYHRGKEAFQNEGSAELGRAAKETILPYRHLNRAGDFVNAHVSISSVLMQYHDIAKADAKTFQRMLKEHTEQFPEAINRLCQSDASSILSNLNGRATVSVYRRLVAFAGDVTVADRES